MRAREPLAALGALVLGNMGEGNEPVRYGDIEKDNARTDYTTISGWRILMNHLETNQAADTQSISYKDLTF